MTPRCGERGARSGELFFQLQLFANRTAAWKAFDSSTVFSLTDGSVLSPDASPVGFPPLCPLQKQRLSQSPAGRLPTNPF